MSTLTAANDGGSAYFAFMEHKSTLGVSTFAEFEANYWPSFKAQYQAALSAQIANPLPDASSPVEKLGSVVELYVDRALFDLARDLSKMDMTHCNRKMSNTDFLQNYVGEAIERDHSGVPVSTVLDTIGVKDLSAFQQNCLERITSTLRHSWPQFYARNQQSTFDQEKFIRFFKREFRNLKLNAETAPATPAATVVSAHASVDVAESELQFEVAPLTSAHGPLAMLAADVFEIVDESTGLMSFADLFGFSSAELAHVIEFQNRADLQRIENDMDLENRYSDWARRRREQAARAKARAAEALRRARERHDDRSTARKAARKEARRTPVSPAPAPGVTPKPLPPPPQEPEMEPEMMPEGGDGEQSTESQGGRFEHRRYYSDDEDDMFSGQPAKATVVSASNNLMFGHNALLASKPAAAPTPVSSSKPGLITFEELTRLQQNASPVAAGNLRELTPADQTKRFKARSVDYLNKFLEKHGEQLAGQDLLFLAPSDARLNTSSRASQLLANSSDAQNAMVSVHLFENVSTGVAGSCLEPVFTTGRRVSVSANHEASCSTGLRFPISPDSDHLYCEKHDITVRIHLHDDMLPLKQ